MRQPSIKRNYGRYGKKDGSKENYQQTRCAPKYAVYFGKQQAANQSSPTLKQNDSHILKIA